MFWVPLEAHLPPSFRDGSSRGDAALTTVSACRDAAHQPLPRSHVGAARCQLLTRPSSRTPVQIEVEEDRAISQLTALPQQKTARDGVTCSTRRHTRSGRSRATRSRSGMSAIASAAAICTVASSGRCRTVHPFTWPEHPPKRPHLPRSSAAGISHDCLVSPRRSFGFPAVRSTSHNARLQQLSQRSASLNMYLRHPRRLTLPQNIPQDCPAYANSAPFRERSRRARSLPERVSSA